jgi:hypothetical protein
MKTNIAIKGWEILSLKRKPDKKSDSGIELVTHTHKPLHNKNN